MQRYGQPDPSCVYGLEQDDNGQWVRYDDVVSALAATSAPAEPSENKVGAMQYRGNTVSYMYGRAKAYGDEIMRCWFVLKDAGKHPGRTDDKLHEVLRKALATSAPSEPAEDIVAARIAMRTCEEAWQARGFSGQPSTDFIMGFGAGEAAAVQPAPAVPQCIGVRSASRILPTYFVQHPDGSYSEADPQPEAFVTWQCETPEVKYVPPGPLQWDEPPAVNVVRTAYEQLQREQPEAPAEPSEESLFEAAWHMAVAEAESKCAHQPSELKHCIASLIWRRARATPAAEVEERREPSYRALLEELRNGINTLAMLSPMYDRKEYAIRLKQKIADALATTKQEPRS
jgi:hypothetical protein